MKRVYVLSVGGREEKHFRFDVVEIVSASGNKKALKEYARRRLQQEKNENAVYLIHIYNSQTPFGGADGRIEFRKRSDGTISEKHFFYGVY